MVRRAKADPHSPGSDQADIERAAWEVTKITPILAKEETAAKLMDMTTAEFRRLVKMGCLPPGREIAPGYKRWLVDDLKAITNGDAARGDYEIKW